VRAGLGDEITYRDNAFATFAADPDDQIVLGYTLHLQLLSNISIFRGEACHPQGIHDNCQECE